MLEAGYCRQRQRRLLKVMQERRLDAVLCAAPRHVQYLTGHRPWFTHEAAVVLRADGTAWLCSANRPVESAAVDRAVAYEAKRMSTQPQEQPALVGRAAAGELRGCRRIGYDASRVASQVVAGWDGTCEPIDEAVFQLRRRKDPDELAIVKRAIACTQAMYRRAREMIAPGVSEIDVYNELHAAAVRTAGGPLSAHLGNDFACGARGGQPRAGRLAQAGELYILDLGPACGGYFADNARTFSVDGRPTDAQMQAWEAVVGCLKIVEAHARAGVRCRDLFERVDAYLKENRGEGLPHHLGHGVGLEPHEYPHLNPRWDDVLMEGEVFTAEPGVYAEALRAGIRIENQYLVTAGGVENLVDYPLELA